MPTRIACGLSTAEDVRTGALRAAGEAAAGLKGARADLAVVFASGAHLAEPEVTLASVYEALDPDVLVGCGAGGVLAGGREVEHGTAVTVWAASFPDGVVSTFHAETLEVDSEQGVAVGGIPDLEGAAGVILLPDPFTFPVDGVLSELAARAPGVPVLGGVSSAARPGGGSVLFIGERVLDAGAVGLRLDGIEMLPCVSQGATPIGPELTITAGEGGSIHELAGKPALHAVGALLDELEPEQRAAVARNPLLGLVIDSGRPEYGQGDFLVSGLLGGDPETGSIAIGRPVEPGQIVRVHARDAASADRDLREALQLRRAALGDDGAAGALVFTCNGRGRSMFDVPDHDAAAILDELGPDVPAAGFFAAGEIGPVGGQSFMHGFTATVAVFAA